MLKQILIMLFFSNAIAMATEKTHLIDTSKEVIVRYIKESECGTGASESAFYTFSYSLASDRSEVVSKIRELYNGGANYDPTTTDYYFDSDGTVTVEYRNYDRKHREKLEGGFNAEGKLTKRVVFKIGEKLTEEQRKLSLEVYHAIRSYQNMKLLRGGKAK